jgi:hypothetical protein
MISGIIYYRCSLFNHRSTYSNPLVLWIYVIILLNSPKIEYQLSYDAVNPAHVPLYAENSCTLGTFCSSRIGWADIEVANVPITSSAIDTLPCYPLSNFFFWSKHFYVLVHFDQQKVLSFHFWPADKPVSVK